MKPYFDDGTVSLYLGDCLEVMRFVPDESVDAVVTDPPYALTELPADVVTDALRAWLEGDRAYIPRTGAGGFMGSDWDKFVPPPAAWDQCMRVLKPGGHLLAFAAPRTQDLMAMSVRLAGFEIRDGMAWIFGQGYPKSLDVSKAIDKRRDDREAVNRVTGWLAGQRDRAGVTNRDIDAAFGFSGMAGHWTAAPHLKVALVPQWGQWERLRELIGFGSEMDAEVWRLNGRKDSPGEAWAGREVVGERVTGIGTGRGAVAFIGDSGNRDITAPATDDARRWEGWGTALKPAHEPVIVARKRLAGTVAENVLEHGTGAVNVNGCRAGSEARVNHGGGASSLQRVSRVEHGYRPTVTGSSGKDGEVIGRWPPNVLLSEEAAAELDRQTGVLTSGANPAHRNPDKFRDAYGEFAGQRECAVQRGADSGGASRFFPVFRYEAKASASERPRLPDGTAHNTVKPVGLMRWLVRLVTPPGGLVLDCFAGSGTTGEACIVEGFRSVLIERDPKYAELILARLRKPIQPDLFGGAS